MLAAVLVLSKIALFILTIDRLGGFDARTHTIVTESILAAPFNMPLRTMFYAYHPPLAFLMARGIQQFGLSTMLAIKCVSLLSMLAAFLWMRESLRRLGLLHRPHGLLFLYICFGLPIAAFMGHRANLEAPLFAIMSLSIWTCVAAFQERHSASPNRVTLYIILGSFALAAGLLTKFSGMTLLAIPLLTAIAMGTDSMWRRCVLALLMVLAAVLLVSPYYYHRYYLRAGVLFPSNTDWLRANELTEYREKRDADRVRFFIDLLSPTHAHTASGYIQRDWSTIRLTDAWRDLWLKDAFLGQVPDSMRRLGIAYIWTGAFAALVGAIALIYWQRTEIAWQRLGFVTLGLACFTLTLFITYLYTQPLARWGPGKGLYAASALPGIAYLLAMPLALWERRDYPRWLWWCLAIFLSTFIVLNHCFMNY